MKKALCIIMLTAAFAASFFMRDYNIENRIWHADESEQASTFADLLLNGDYEYNPNGPHGPTLYYFAFACHQLPNIKYFDMAQEANVSADTPVQSKNDGLSIILLRKLLAPWLLIIFVCYLIGSVYSGTAAAWAACACFALSGLSCIYAGYFVHEIIFAASALIFAQCLWALLKNPSFKWAVAVGLSAGFMQSTKETSIIVFFSAAVAACAILAINREVREKLFEKSFAKIIYLGTAALGGFAAMICVFYSSFGANPSGILDAFLSYSHFFGKSASESFAEPAWYYTKLLAISKSEGVWFGELPITILFFAGLARAVAAIREGERQYAQKAEYILYCAICAAVQILVLSFITYKTPWLLLAPIALMCVVSGYGATGLLRSKKFLPLVFGFAILATLGYWQFRLSENAAVKYPQDPRNPMIFSHTVSDYKNLLSRISDAERVSEYGGDIPIAFVMGNESPWPAPWDLRNYANVGFWRNDFPKNISNFEVIVCAPSTAEAVGKAIGDEKYVPEFFGIRKNVVLTLYIKKELFEKLIR